VPWLAIRELLQSYFALDQVEGVEAIRRSVSQQLLALDAGFEDAIPLVLEVLGVGDAAAPDGPPQRVATRLAAFMRRFVRLRSANEPILLLLDDAHWIDRASDELVQEVGASVRDTRTLLLANFRPEYRPAWIGGSHYQQLALSPLGEGASRELVQDLLGSDGSLGEVSDLIRERTAGNPFFTEEVVHALAASGSLIGERGAYRLTAPVDTLALPETVQSLLAARIDRLGEQAKHLLQAAAVIGKQFDEPLLGEVSGLDGHDLGAALAALQDGEFMRLVAPSPRPEYAFKHPLMRDVAYRSQLAERRARLHAAVATALEKLRADRLGEHASLIAHHWEASGVRLEAARWKRRAALRVASIKVTGQGRRQRP
jgi:adenylate cyclase